MPDVAEIAGRLSANMKRILRESLPHLGSHNHFIYPSWGYTLGSVAGMARRGLVERSTEFDGPDAWECGDHGYVTLTPLGLAVRAYLENSHD